MTSTLHIVVQLSGKLIKNLRYGSKSQKKKFVEFESMKTKIVGVPPTLIAEVLDL